jgi:hypothetical protein
VLADLATYFDIICDMLLKICIHHQPLFGFRIKVPRYTLFFEYRRNVGFTAVYSFVNADYYNWIVSWYLLNRYFAIEVLF